MEQINGSRSLTVGHVVAEVMKRERIGVHMADAIDRLTSADKVGVFPSGGGSFIKPAFNATMHFHPVTRHAEIVTSTSQVIPALRRACAMARNGRPGLVPIEFAGAASLGSPMAAACTATRAISVGRASDGHNDGEDDDPGLAGAVHGREGDGRRRSQQLAKSAA